MSGSFGSDWIPESFLIPGDPADAASQNRFVNGDLYTTVTSVAARNAFTTVFVILNLLTGLAGVSMLQWRNAAKLLQKGHVGQSVPIYMLSPWMSASDTFLYRWYTGHLPGGHFGFYMLTTGIFGIVHQYFTSSFIFSVPGVYGQCAFSTGVVFLPENTAIVVPASAWPAADVALYSQYITAWHGDPPGIYAKANSDSNFTVLANSADYLGNWTCTASGSTTFPPRSTIDAINSTLIANQLVYPNSWSSWHRIGKQSNPLNGLLIWSSSEPDDSTNAWDVKASVAPGLSDPDDSVVMYSYECSMNGPQIEWILPLIPSASTLAEWSERTYGGLVQGSDYVNPGNGSTFGFTLEITLNAMIMVAGSLNIATRAADGYYDSLSTYRCKLERTIIRKEMFAMLGFLILHLCCFIPLGIRYWIQIRFSDRQRRKAIKEIPSDASSWQVAVLRDHFPQWASAITAKDIPDYRYGWDTNGGDVLRFSRNGVWSDRVEQVAFLPKMDANTGYQYGGNAMG